MNAYFKLLWLNISIQLSVGQAKSKKVNNVYVSFPLVAALAKILIFKYHIKSMHFILVCYVILSTSFWD